MFEDSVEQRNIIELNKCESIIGNYETEERKSPIVRENTIQAKTVAMNERMVKKMTDIF